MKKSLLIILTILTIGLLSSCDYFKEGHQYGDTATEFMKALMHKDYDKCTSLLMLSKNAERKTYMDTIKTGLKELHDRLARQYGEELNYSFLQVEKNNPEAVQSPTTTTIILQISNDQYRDAMEASFDNKTGKIATIRSLDAKDPIPDMTRFWLFGAFAILIPLFNLYAIFRVIQSNMANKLVRYAAIILINVTAIGYSPSHGLFFKFISLQYMLGINFIKMGYGSAWIFGIPVAAIFTLWQLKKGNYKKDQNIKAQIHQVKGKRFKANK